jgi:pteridine reductase
VTTAQPPAPAGDRPVALITGAARRVGRAVALAFARAGYDLVITYNTSADDADRTADDLRRAGARVKTGRLDLADLAAAESAGRELARTLPRLDALVHNASTYDQTPLATLTGADLLRHYTVHAAAPLLLSRELAPLLARSPLPGGGAIVAMADIHALGEHGLPRRDNFAAYAMSKAALVEMIRTLARELAPRVRANAIAPGVVAWPDAGHESDDATQTAYLKRVPLARPGTPEEAAAAVLFLAQGATYTTGQILRLDGGRSMV